MGREHRRRGSGRGIGSRLSFMGRPAHPHSRRTGRTDIEFPGRNRGTPISKSGDPHLKDIILGAVGDERPFADEFADYVSTCGRSRNLW